MTRTTLRHLFTVAASLTLAALVLAACGGDDDSGSKGGGGSSTGSKGSGADCGNTTAGKLQVVRHCGDASGEITVSGKTTKLDDGACQNTDQAVVINLGVSLVDPAATADDRKKFQYMGLLAGKHPAAQKTAVPADKDGTFEKDVLVSGIIDGAYIAAPSVRLELTGNRNEGTFSGKDAAGVEISGKFRCS